jgi:hypothetical protein
LLPPMAELTGVPDCIPHDCSPPPSSLRGRGSRGGAVCSLKLRGSARLGSGDTELQSAAASTSPSARDRF